MDSRQLRDYKKLQVSPDMSRLESLWMECLTAPKAPGRGMMPISPSEARAILWNDYLLKIFEIKKIHDRFNIEVPGYADKMRSGEWRLQDLNNRIPVYGNPNERLSNHRLWGILQSGQTVVLPMSCKYVNFEEVYKQNLVKLPEFLNSFFRINLRQY